MNTDTITTTGWTGRLDMGLAPRELEATLLAAADMTVKQVAQLMGVAPKTVEKRLESARFKLGDKTMPCCCRHDRHGLRSCGIW